MGALATRPEGWTYSILKEPCVYHRLHSSGADLFARSLTRRILPSGFRPRSPQESCFGVTFRSISAVDPLIYDFSVHMVPPPPWTALQFEFIEWPSTWQSTHPTTTRDVQSRPLHHLCLLFFHTGKLCSGSMVHLEIFLPTLCLVSSGFLANLFLISFCIQNRLRGNHCLRSPSFCMVCTSRKWRRWYEETKREKRLRNEQAPK